MRLPGKQIYSRVVAALQSKGGHNAAVFAAFLGVSAMLWWVMALNDEDQTDVRLPLRITNVPDSVTIISTPPPAIAASLRAKASQLVKISLGHAPALKVDFRAYRQGNVMRLTDADIKALVRGAIDGSAVSVVTPDSLRLLFTTAPGRPVAVRLDYNLTTAPKATPAGRPILSLDSVMAYAAPGAHIGHTVSTEEVSLSGIDHTVVQRVRLAAPAGGRLIPDSVDVTFPVESLIFRTLKYQIEASGVPAGYRLITFPSQLEVSYLVPRSNYKATPPMRLIVDYHSLDGGNARMARVRLHDVPADLRNVQLSADSVEYIIERL